jgi:hypothetical protein
MHSYKHMSIQGISKDIARQLLLLIIQWPLEKKAQ